MSLQIAALHDEGECCNYNPLTDTLHLLTDEPQYYSSSNGKNFDSPLSPATTISLLLLLLLFFFLPDYFLNKQC